MNDQGSSRTDVWSDDEALGGRIASLLPRHVTDRGQLVLAPSAPTSTVRDQLMDRLRSVADGGRIVLLSSTEVQVPSWRHPGLVPETSLRALHRQSSGEPLARAWVQLEQAFVEVASECGLDDLAVLRCAPFAGRWGALAPIGRRRASPGFDPLVQALSIEDLKTALHCVLGLAGDDPRAEPGSGEVRAFHVVPSDAARWSQIRRAIRDKRRSDSSGQPYPFPASAYRRHDWTAGGDRAEQQLGFRAVRPTLQAVGDSAAAPLDPFGCDERFIERAGRWVLGPLARRYFRLELRGLEHLPRQGPAVLAGMHRGFMPLDAMVLLDQVRRSKGRIIRFLIHPALQRFPVLSPIFSRLGGLIANRRNAEWVLGQGRLLGLFPEGIQGGFSLYRDAYRIHRFARDEFVRLAIVHGAPIVTFVHCGPAEVFPMLAHVRWPAFEKFTGWPTFPITTSFPLMPPVPLPSKWHVHLQPPITPPRSGAEAARDRGLVRELSAQCREQMEAALSDLLRRRRSPWWGSLRPATGDTT